MTTTRTTRLAALPAAAVLALGLAACSDDGGTTAGAEASSAPTSTAPSSATPAGASEPFGDGCSAVPAEGAGSFSGMSSDPVATAASNNPVLSTLVSAVQQAGLVDTLNSAQDITVFAPTNDAFAAVPEADLQAVLADKEALTTVLTYHVVGQTVEPEQLADGSFQTLQGATLTTAGTGEDVTVGAMDAQVVCGNVTTANARVYLIDQVLMPPAA